MFARVLNRNICKPRHFSHLKQNDMLRSKISKIIEDRPIDRHSPHDNRTSDLIKMITNKDYSGAIILVKYKGLDPDSHNRGENTALTDCAKRGDLDGTVFCLKELKCNPFVSCHCPDHRTCFHYSAMGGHIDILKVLYDHIGDTYNKNLLTSSGRTPLDVAKDEKTRIFMLTYKAQSKDDLLKLKEPELIKLKAPKT